VAYVRVKPTYLTLCHRNADRYKFQKVEALNGSESTTLVQFVLLFQSSSYKLFSDSITICSIKLSYQNLSFLWLAHSAESSFESKYQEAA
jgi:hypothetical protein